jgi:hypothetical protein
MLEFVLILSIAIVTGIVYLAIGNELIFRGSEEQRVIALNDIGYSVQDELITASYVEDGYTRIFSLPQRAGRFIYTVSSDNTSLELTSGQATITYSLPSHQGDIVIGENVIKKDNGLVVLV